MQINAWFFVHSSIPLQKDIYNLKSSFVFPTIANASSDRLQCLLHGLLVRTPCQVPWRKRRCQASLKRRVQRRFISIEMVLVVMSHPQSFNPKWWNICWVMHVESGGQGQGTDKLLFPRKNCLQNQGETWLEKLLLNLMVAPKKAQQLRTSQKWSTRGYSCDQHSPSISQQNEIIAVPYTSQWQIHARGW